MYFCEILRNFCKIERNVLKIPRHFYKISTEILRKSPESSQNFWFFKIVFCEILRKIHEILKKFRGISWKFHEISQSTFFFFNCQILFYSVSPSVENLKKLLFLSLWVEVKVKDF